MDRAYQSGASGSAPAAPGSPSTGYPTAGNPGTGTPATKPGPYWYHMIMEELMAIIGAAGITPAPGNLTQLLTALRSAGVFQTPAQFDNTTKAATTAFVQRALGNFSGLNAYNASATLLVSDIGKLVAFYGATAGQTLTLPAVAGIPTGNNYTLVNQASTPVTIKGNAAENISRNVTGVGQSLSNTVVLNPGDSLVLSSNGGSQWNAEGQTAPDMFPNSLAGNGYQKLPNGLIIQWGSITTAAGSAVVTFPIAFPGACRQVIPSVAYNSGVPNVTVDTSGPSTTGFTIYTKTASSGAAVAANTCWIAFGQ